MTFHKKPAALPLMLALAAALSGCVSFGGKPPERLLSLDAAQKVAPGTLRSATAGTTLTVADPEAPKLLDTVRVPVRTSPTTLARLPFMPLRACMSWPVSSFVVTSMRLVRSPAATASAT